MCVCVRVCVCVCVCVCVRFDRFHVLLVRFAAQQQRRAAGDALIAWPVRTTKLDATSSSTTTTTTMMTAARRTSEDELWLQLLSAAIAVDAHPLELALAQVRKTFC